MTSSLSIKLISQVDEVQTYLVRCHGHKLYYCFAVFTFVVHGIFLYPIKTWMTSSLSIIRISQLVESQTHSMHVLYRWCVPTVCTAAVSLLVVTFLTLSLITHLCVWYVFLYPIKNMGDFEFVYNKNHPVKRIQCRYYLSCLCSRLHTNTPPKISHVHYQVYFTRPPTPKAWSKIASLFRCCLCNVFFCTPWKHEWLRVCLY